MLMRAGEKYMYTTVRVYIWVIYLHKIQSIFCSGIQMLEILNCLKHKWSTNFQVELLKLNFQSSIKVTYAPKKQKQATLQDHQQSL